MNLHVIYYRAAIRIILDVCAASYFILRHRRLYIRAQTEWASLARRTTTLRVSQIHVLFGMCVLFFSRSSLPDVFLKGIRRTGQGHNTGCLCRTPVFKKHPTDLPFVCVKAFTTSTLTSLYSYLSTLIRFPARAPPRQFIDILLLQLPPKLSNSRHEGSETRLLRIGFPNGF